jgi:hypothetical protein
MQRLCLQLQLQQPYAHTYAYADPTATIAPTTLSDLRHLWGNLSAYLTSGGSDVSGKEPMTRMLL